MPMLVESLQVEVNAIKSLADRIEKARENLLQSVNEILSHRLYCNDDDSVSVR